MDIDTAFPLKIYLNLGIRDDRRQRMKRQFAAAGLEVVRQPAIRGDWLTSHHGFPDRGRRACAMTKRLALRRARFANADAVLLFEDDVVLAPDFRERLARIDLPDDWGMFFLGCEHVEAPDPVGEGLVRVRRARGNHAFAVRAPYFRKIASAIRGGKDLDRGTLGPSEALIADLQRAIPTYAVAPAVAWQASGHSTLERRVTRHYREDGSEVLQSEAIGASLV